MPKPTSQSLQPLANVVIKTNQLGSNVFLKNVTPAELMYLIADNHIQAGGDPVISFHEQREADEQARLEVLRQEKDSYNEKIKKVEETELPDEVKEKRLSALHQQLRIREDAILMCEKVAWMRSLGPLDERQRLLAKYPAPKLNKFYPGQVPSLPSTFEEARRHGTRMSTESAKDEDKYMFVV